MNKGTRESHYEGWLIKSPPTKRMWRARWRRRWFTLKQGEIPQQFCLEYYTDRNCRKLKGIIDLDQCEQVDCGLRLENRKQKFQYMFDIKTPKRTYYLAADTEADMRDWVNCICQVCHLHDTKQSNELQDESRIQNTTSTANTYSTNNTTTTSLNSSTGPPSAVASVVGATDQPSFNAGILRRSDSGAAATLSSGVVKHQPQSSNAAATYQNNSNTDCAYVNTEYTNRETLLCETHFNRQQLACATAAVVTPTEQQPTSPGAASLYLNSPAFQALHASQNETSRRLAVNANGVVRKIPENLVLNSTPLPESQQHSVQPSPALSTCSGPYIPISECYSGSPKFMLETNNPTTPLNNLDPKFYDTPRSHNNIGLNLTNDDQSYSPKITNCSLQMAAAKNRSHRSDSDSESVFTDDDEWTPLRVNVDRSTRPSDSSVENESFVLTYSQRFSKFPDDPVTSKEHQKNGAENTIAVADPLEKLAKVLKNKNNLILDFKENEKIPRDNIPQLSDTENTSPAIGPRDATSVVEESYDIPRSHHLPYYNMGQLFEKVTSPETNPIAASTPNLMAGLETAPGSAALVRTLPRQHCYTNAAPSQVEGNVFNYDFIEQVDLPPVNRRLKPKGNLEDRPPEELPAKPPTAAAFQPKSPYSVDALATKLMTASIHSPGVFGGEIPLRPPSVDRKLKPSAYKFANSATSPASRRSTGAPLSMVLSNDGETYIYGNTLPRPNYATSSSHAGQSGHGGAGGITIQHQRTASAAAAMQLHQIPLLQPPPKNEHKLQYFDLDVANPPTINRQLSVGNIYTAGGSRVGLGSAIDPSARVPVQSGIVYNSVDFVKTEAFKRIREERKKESEGVNSSSK